jgi:CubicO group peptidase (beta-lactamase class C family)
MDEHNIVGATLAVVQDGEIIFSKGYGYADLENRIPVDPAKTLFRPGSTSKLFTWTAVMQLFEQGLTLSCFGVIWVMLYSNLL